MTKLLRTAAIAGAATVTAILGYEAIAALRQGEVAIASYALAIALSVDLLVIAVNALDKRGARS